MSFTSLLISPHHPFPAISLSLPSHLPISSLTTILSPLCPPSQQSLSLSSGRALPSSSLPLSTLSSTTPCATVFLRLAILLPGGKGGFASQLRAQGGRMSSNKATNNDSCRDLNGRRLSTIKEATKLAKYLEGAPEREKVEVRERKERKEALEKEVGRLEVSVTGGAEGGKRKLEDSKFVEESRELVVGVKDAVRLAMLKKRKKNNPTPTTTVESTETTTTAAASSPSSSTLVQVVEEGTVTSTTESEVVEEVEEEFEGKGKGKGKA